MQPAIHSPVPIPPPPSGYRAPKRFAYPMAMLHVISLVALAASIIAYGILATQAQRITLSQLLPQGLLELVIALLVFPAVILLHEATHGLTYQLLGYRVSYGLAPELGAAYAAAFGQFQKRGHNLIAAIMPLLVITLIGVPLLTVPDNRLLALVMFVALLVNTSGAVGDVYIIWRLLRMPPGTLLYDVSVEQMLIYEPADAP